MMKEFHIGLAKLVIKGANKYFKYHPFSTLLEKERMPKIRYSTTVRVLIVSYKDGIKIRKEKERLRKSSIFSQLYHLSQNIQ
jgi:hypothetical protein